MKYVIYVRKSTEDREDRQVLSIESQLEEIQRRFPDLAVTEIIQESKSAYKPYNRPEFQRMVELFQSGKAQGLLAWHPDRLSREPISGGMVMHLLDKGLIKDLCFASYTFQNTPEGKMMLALTLSQSKYFSEKLGVDVKRGMTKKCTMGSMPTRPPLGYMPDKQAEKGEKRHLKDPERFDLVRKMWELMLTGEYPILKIVKLSKQWGLTTRAAKHTPSKPLSKNTVYKIFSNIYYTGQFEWNGELYKGIYPAMITLEEYERVQMLIGRRYIPRPKKYESITAGLVRCPCGGAVITERRTKYIKAKNSMITYHYARCARHKKGQVCKEPAIELKELEKQMVDRIESIRISDKFHEWAIKNVHQMKGNDEALREKELQNLRKIHDESQKKLDNLFNVMISPINGDKSLLSDEEFKVRKVELTTERNRLSSLIEQCDLRADKTADLLLDIFNIAYHAKNEFNNGDIQKKKSILSKIGVNFLLQGGNLHMDAKRHYISFIEKLPAVRAIETRGKLEEERYGKLKKATEREMISLWSG